MSNAGIKLSPKHGLNPTIPVCFWCGEERNEVALPVTLVMVGNMRILKRRGTWLSTMSRAKSAAQKWRWA